MLTGAFLLCSNLESSNWIAKTQIEARLKYSPASCATDRDADIRFETRDGLGLGLWSRPEARRGEARFWDESVYKKRVSEEIKVFASPLLLANLSQSRLVATIQMRSISCTRFQLSSLFARFNRTRFTSRLHTTSSNSYLGFYFHSASFWLDWILGASPPAQLLDWRASQWCWLAGKLEYEYASESGSESKSEPYLELEVIFGRW